MVSSFYCAPIEDAIYLRVHQGISAGTLTALKKYMIFAKAELNEAPHLIAISLHGEHAQENLSQPTIATLIKHSHTLSDTLVELWIERDKLSALENALGYLQGDKLLWEQQLINLGLAELRQGQSELFLPQELNFDLIGGVNYKKACYIGQEVIPRLHYRGQLKKHLRRITVNLVSAQPSATDDNLYNNAGTKVGTIVQRVAHEQSIQALCLVDDNAFQEHDIYLHNEEQKPEKVLCLSLPYAIPKTEQN